MFYVKRVSLRGRDHDRTAAAYPGGCDCGYVLPLNGRATCEVEE